MREWTPVLGSIQNANFGFSGTAGEILAALKLELPIEN